MLHDSRIERRIPTGVPGLDEALHGGFFRGGLYSLIGTSGTGKSILCNQIAFHHVKNQGGRCVYLTLLAESHAKMMRHMESLEFFDSSQVPEKLLYLSGYRTLRSGGTKAVLDMVRKSLQSHRATLFVLDGLGTILESSEGANEFKEFLYELQTSASVLNCTTLLSTPREADRERIENSIVDGVIIIGYRESGPRLIREIEINKLRGSAHLLGRQPMTISSEGIRVYPRLEASGRPEPAIPTDLGAEPERFGVVGLDEMLCGGILPGDSTAIVGASGTGKTLFGLAFLEAGARAGHPGVYIGFQERAGQLLRKSGSLGIPLEEYARSGQVVIDRLPSGERILDEIGSRVLDHVRAASSQASSNRCRVFIDGLSGFRLASMYSERFPRYMKVFCDELRALRADTLIVDDLEVFQSSPHLLTTEIATIVSNLALLRCEEREGSLRRTITLYKCRESSCNREVREFRIAQGGIHLQMAERGREAA